MLSTQFTSIVVADDKSQRPNSYVRYIVRCCRRRPVASIYIYVCHSSPLLDDR